MSAAPKLVALIVAFFLAANAARADSFTDARAAYDRGDFGTARETFLTLAELGDPKAQTMMGDIYARGRAVRIDLKVALDWYRKAAAKGEAVAQFYAAKLLVMSALVGYAREEATAGPQDVLSLLMASAQQDNAPAQVLLAMWLADKTDTTRTIVSNKTEPDLTAIENFAEFPVIALPLVKAIPKDNAQSAAWFEKAAAHDNVVAQAILAERYATGVGVPLDNARALFWISLAMREPISDEIVPAARLYNERMKTLRDRVAGKLNAAERAVVASNVANWKPRPAPQFGTEPDTSYEHADKRFSVFTRTL